MALVVEVLRGTLLNLSWGPPPPAMSPIALHHRSTLHLPPRPVPPRPIPPSNASTAEEEAQGWRNSKEIQVNGDGIPKPCLTFEEASMPAYVLSEVMKCGFNEPSPIQSQGWPMALLGRDMVGISKTGSGKTLAFLLPAMIHINAQVI